MIHRAPDSVAPLFAQPTDTPPGNNAAPRGGGAGVNGRNSHPNLLRLTLTPPARNNAPPGTSGVAAGRIVGHATTQRVRVLAFIAGQGPHGATDDEAESALGIKPQTYTPRRGELVALGLVVDSRRRRNTASGRPAAVWIAATHADRSPGADGGAA
jgi:hypothetical protein